MNGDGHAIGLAQIEEKIGFRVPGRVLTVCACIGDAGGEEGIGALRRLLSAKYVRAEQDISGESEDAP